MKSHRYKDLVVWQKAMQLVAEVYRVSNQLPKNEEFGLSAQMRRAAVGIPSNIAEGHLRTSPKEFIYFLSIASGSAAELEIQLLLCISTQLIREDEVKVALTSVDEIRRMLYGLKSHVELRTRVGHS